MPAPRCGRSARLSLRERAASRVQHPLSRRQARPAAGHQGGAHFRCRDLHAGDRAGLLPDVGSGSGRSGAELSDHAAKAATLSTGWVIAEGNTGSYSFQVRLRRFATQFSRCSFPLRLNIFWSMAKADAKGYPSIAELEVLHSFENRLVKALEPGGVAVLAMVLTGRGE